MKDLTSHLRGAIVSALICCGLYPLLVWGISQAAFRDKAKASELIRANTDGADFGLLGEWRG